jgi:hypothetical protein
VGKEDKKGEERKVSRRMKGREGRGRQREGDVLLFLNRIDHSLTLTLSSFILHFFLDIRRSSGSCGR